MTTKKRLGFLDAQNWLCFCIFQRRNSDILSVRRWAARDQRNKLFWEKIQSQVRSASLALSMLKDKIVEGTSLRIFFRNSLNIPHKIEHQLIMTALNVFALRNWMRESWGKREVLRMRLYLSKKEERFLVNVLEISDYEKAKSYLKIQLQLSTKKNTKINVSKIRRRKFRYGKIISLICYAK